MTEQQITAVDLFCGVGGLTHGLALSGIDVVLGVDIDGACRHPYEHNNRARFLQADVEALDSSIIASHLSHGNIKLLAGCAPCQPFSTYSRKAKRESGLRKGRGNPDDWRLVARFGELVSELSPDLVTMENVPPLADKAVFHELCERLSSYSISWGIIDCQKIGLPQTRKRLVLVASKLGEICIPDFDMEPLTVRAAISSLPAISAGERYEHDRMHQASSLSKINLERIKHSVPGGSWRDWPEELRAACHQKKSGETYPSVYGRMEWDKPAPTITTQAFGYGNGRFGHPEQDRAISLREAAILQGFPRNYSFVPDDGEVNFSVLGRLIGNAVPVRLGEVIGNILANHVRTYAL